MRTVLGFCLASALVSVLFAAVFVFDVDVAISVERAVEHRLPASELGEPGRTWRRDFECVRGWTCDACAQLQADVQPGEQVLAFGRGLRFYVLVGTDGRVRRAARCGS